MERIILGARLWEEEAEKGIFGQYEDVVIFPH